MTVIRNGVPWYDTAGDVVNAHGVGIIRHEGLYYMFGESKTDERNMFAGFSCYSSPDLATWTFEGLVLPPQQDGLLGPARIGERPKVLRSPATGRFVLYAHADDLTYYDPHIVVAVSDSITGPYELVGPLMHDGEPLKRWDMGVFDDDDGKAYLLTHEGDIYLLSDDRLDVVSRVAAGVAPAGESPAMLKSDGEYWLMLSNKTMWERNDNFLLSAPSPSGPWTHRGLLAPEGTLTHNSQCSFVLRLEDGRHVYLGDRWSFPHQASAATQVWLPLTITPDGVSLPRYLPEWSIDGRIEECDGTTTQVPFCARSEGESFEFPFTGRGVRIVGESASDGSYGRVEMIRDGVVVVAQIVDWYSLVSDFGTRWVSPPLPEGAYRLRISATGERPEWFKKDGSRFGPTDTFVRVTSVEVF